MDESTSLLAAVYARPADDAPRLAYADWLDDQPASVTCEACGGHGYARRHKPYSRTLLSGTCARCDRAGTLPTGCAARAEFVRLQCRIARLEADCLCGACVRRRGGGQHHNGPCAVDQERDAAPDGSSRPAMLRHRERELLEATTPGMPYKGRNRYWWAPASVRKVMAGGAMDVGYRRGFVEEIHCPVGVWLAHAAELYWHPDLPCRAIGPDHGACPACAGTGTPPRPDTALPLLSRLVVTSFHCTPAEWAWCYAEVRESGADRMTHAEWVEFGYTGTYHTGAWWLRALRHAWPALTIENGFA